MKRQLHVPTWIFSTSAALAAVVLVTILSTTPRVVDAVVEKGPAPRSLDSCYKRYGNVNLRTVVGQLVVWYCDNTVISGIRAKTLKLNMSPSSRKYVNGLADKVMSRRRRHKRQAEPKCQRKEYRMLTDVERNTFHNALNTLKMNTSVSPNKFDALARIHTGAVDTAHGGPNFLGWHRVYLLIFEIALQEVDGSICMPYWDSSLDNELPSPWESYVFSADFLGGSDLLDGPFARWNATENITLIRNVGGDGELFQIAGIEDILSRERTHEIIPPNADPQYDLEFQHGGVHVFMGGHMLQLQTASYDPAFWLHHAFVDYLWELFRTKQRAQRINPELDYPEDFGSELHHFNSSMGFGLGLTAEQGYSDSLTDFYEYQHSPDCSQVRRSCGSKYLRCNVTRGRCYPVDPNTVRPEPTTPDPRPSPSPMPTNPTIPTNPTFPTNPTNPTNPTFPPTQDPTDPWPQPPPTCHKKQQKIFPIQNSYCLDGVCDISGWVYVPVKVVSMRPPGMTNYGSFPVKKGKIINTNDIYKDSAYAGTNQFINSIKGFPKGYERCDDQQGFSQIFVQSTGLNYDGLYKESAIIDQRLATSLAVAYVAVKNPRQGRVRALFRAFDSCGRICHSACKVPGSSGQYQPCSGVMDIADVRGKSRQYSSTYGQATLNTWGYAQNKDCPKFLVDDFALTFYCDYRDHITWADRKATPLKPLPTQAAVNTPIQRPNECRVDNDCVIGVPCNLGKSQCKIYGETHKCLGSCNKYAVCNYGRYWTRTCPFQTSFNDRWHTCTNRKMCWDKPKPLGHNHFSARRPNPFRNPLRRSQNNYLLNLSSRFMGRRRGTMIG